MKNRFIFIGVHPFVSITPKNEEGNRTVIAFCRGNDMGLTFIAGTPLSIVMPENKHGTRKAFMFLGGKNVRKTVHKNLIGINVSAYLADIPYAFRRLFTPAKAPKRSVQYCRMNPVKAQEWVDAHEGTDARAYPSQVDFLKVWDGKRWSGGEDVPAAVQENCGADIAADKDGGVAEY